MIEWHPALEYFLSEMKQQIQFTYHLITVTRKTPPSSLFFRLEIIGLFAKFL